MIDDSKKQLLSVGLKMFNGQYSTDYGALFADGLKSGATLYRVEGAGADMHFVPLNGEEAAS